MLSNAIAFGALGGAAVLAAPFVLPSSAIVERRRVIQAPSADIFALLSSNAGFQAFNPFRDAEPDLEIELSGPQHGVGSSFAFKGRRQAGTQTIIAIDDNRSVTMQIDLGWMGKPVQTFRLVPMAGGTEVIWRTQSRFGWNPLGRIFGRFMDAMLGPLYERGLADLEHAVAARIAAAR